MDRLRVATDAGTPQSHNAVGQPCVPAHLCSRARPACVASLTSCSWHHLPPDPTLGMLVTERKATEKNNKQESGTFWDILSIQGASKRILG